MEGEFEPENKKNMLDAAIVGATLGSVFIFSLKSVFGSIIGWLGLRLFTKILDKLKGKDDGYPNEISKTESSEVP